MTLNINDTDQVAAAELTVDRLQVFGMVGNPLPTSLDAGVPLCDVQEAASHANARTTIRYDRGRASLDRHATYIVAAFVAGAAR
jgi:hypothetical protein